MATATERLSPIFRFSHPSLPDEGGDGEAFLSFATAPESVPEDELRGFLTMVFGED
jgi:hypothetical protein